MGKPHKKKLKALNLCSTHGASRAFPLFLSFSPEFTLPFPAIFAGETPTRLCCRQWLLSPRLSLSFSSTKSFSHPLQLTFTLYYLFFSLLPPNTATYDHQRRQRVGKHAPARMDQKEPKRGKVAP